ncbi:MAG: hypothetical protein Q7R73_03060 [bacterium]|nr:hypothetical protein [bacterium]
MHYKHEWFEKTLVNASAKKTLAEAAPEWEFSHIGVVEITTGKKYGSCQICHARIMQFVAIRNKKNGMYLLIGADCYDKLLHYLATEKIEAVTLVERRQYIAAIKKYAKKNLTVAFLAWFKGQKTIPETIKETLAVIKKLKYPPSLKTAEELVEYYKAHRRFSLAQLLTDEEQYLLESYSRPPRLPKTCTLKALPEIQEKIRAWAEAAKERERQREEEKRLRREEEREKNQKLAKEKGLAEMERRIKENPSRYQKGVFQRQIFRGKEEWFFRQNGAKYILSDRFGWEGKSETTYVTITREIIPDRAYIVWPLIMDTWGWSVVDFAWRPKEEQAFRKIHPHHSIT